MVYHPDDFAPSINDMCDNALSRMMVFQEGGLVVMEPGDAYVSNILERNKQLNTVEYDTIARARIADMHNDIVQGELPPFAVQLGGAAIISLAREAAFLGTGQTVIVPTSELSEDEVRTKLLMNERAVHDRKPVSIVTFELGSRGIASLVLGPTDDAWELYYESHRRAVRFLNS